MLLLLVPLLALLNAQDDTPADLYFRVTATGNVNVRVMAFDVADNSWKQRVPAALGCNWVEQDSSDYMLEGVCLHWLSPGVDRVRVAPLVALLHASGARPVNVTITPPPDGKAKSALTFRSLHGEPPPDFPVEVRAYDPARLVVPVLLVLFLPGLIAYAIRLRATGATAEEKLNWLVWMNWINLAAWLYWITAVRPDDVAEFAASAGITSMIGGFAFGVLLFVAPPLLAIAACLTALAPLLSSSEESFMLLLKRQIVAESTFMLPLGIFLVGGGIIYILVAYLVYRGLAVLSWRLSFGESVALESGELFDRAAAMARKAGVKLARISIMRTRVPEEANAFATSGDAIVLTQSLVNGLTPREVDAVIAHELGHHKSGHLTSSLPMILFFAYVLFGGPAVYWVIYRLGLPEWVASIPIAPLLFVFLQGVTSQRREYAADARAIEITGDPEGKIAALARLAQLSRIPVQNSGIMGSILSHPSMEKRVLTLARRGGVPDERALAVLHDPDAAYSERPVRVAPEPEPQSEPLFNLREKVMFMEKLHWLRFLLPLAVVSALVATLPAYLVLAAPLIALAAMLGAEALLEKSFVAKLRRRIARRVQPPQGAIFAGIHPGHGVRATEGFTDWDFGFFHFEGDWLVYRGERTSFALSRQGFMRLSIVKGRFTYLRERRVELEYCGGTLTIGLVPRFIDQIEAWIAAGDGPEPATPAPAEPPALPDLPGLSLTRASAFWGIAKAGLKQVVAGTILMSILYRISPLAALVPFLSAIAVMLLELPPLFWPLRPPPPLSARRRLNPA